MVTEVGAATALVVTLKVALVAPAATVTLAGTVTAGLLLESATCAPPAGAAALSVAVPVAVPPPVTLAGLTASDARHRRDRDARGHERRAPEQHVHRRARVAQRVDDDPVCSPPGS